MTRLASPAALIAFAQHQLDWWPAWASLSGDPIAELAAWPGDPRDIVSAGALDHASWPDPESGRVGSLGLPPAILAALPEPRRLLVRQLLARFAWAHVTGQLVSWGHCVDLGDGDALERLPVGFWRHGGVALAGGRLRLLVNGAGIALVETAGDGLAAITIAAAIDASAEASANPRLALKPRRNRPERLTPTLARLLELYDPAEEPEPAVAAAQRRLAKEKGWAVDRKVVRRALDVLWREAMAGTYSGRVGE
jgi:hypothetical protein